MSIHLDRVHRFNTADPGELTRALQQFESNVEAALRGIDVSAGLTAPVALSDLDTTGATTGNLVTFNGTAWIPQAPAAPTAVNTTPTRAHDTSLSPLALWQLDGTPFADSIGGLTLNVSSSSHGINRIAPGLKGFRFNNTLNFVRGGHDASLALTGAMSFEAILRVDCASVSDNECLIAFADGGFPGDGSSNCLYRLLLAMNNTDTSSPLGIIWEQENGAGKAMSRYNSTGYSVPTGQTCHLAVTRSAASAGQQTLKVYINAVLMDTFTTLAACDGGSASRLSIGKKAHNTSAFLADLCSMASVKLFNTELSAANVLAEYTYVVN